MKRKAEHMLDRDNLSDDELPPSNTTVNPADIATPEQIAQRRIVKLKMPSQLGGGEPANRPAAKLELAGSLGGSTTEPQAQPATTAAPSFLSKTVTPSDTGAQQTNGSAPSLFSNLLKKSAQDEGIIVEEKKEEAKPSLFAGLFNKKPEGTAAPLFSGQGTGLFSESKTEGLFSQNKPGGLFGSIFPGSGAGLAGLANKDYSYVHKETGEKKPEPTEEQKPAAAEKPQQDKPAPLFASLSSYKPPAAENKPTLFGSLFSGQPTTFTSSLFNQQSSGLFSQNKGGDDDSEGEGGDDEVQRTPSPEADVTKSKGNYKYEVDYEKIAGKKVTKFKPGSKNMLLEGEVSLNKRGDAYFIIYRNKAKLAQFQGNLYPKLSTIEYLNPRQDALSVKTYVPNKAAETPKEGEEPKENKPKISVEVVKIMFATPDECNDFKRELEKVIS